MNETFYGTAKFLVKADKLDSAIALMQSLTRDTNAKEEGCIDYYYLRSSTNEREFTSIEIWKSEAEEAKHWQTAHVQAALAQMPDMLEALPEIFKWKKLA